jgi:hypothetical protein
MIYSKSKKTVLRGTFLLTSFYQNPRKSINSLTQMFDEKDLSNKRITFINVSM